MVVAVVGVIAVAGAAASSGCSAIGAVRAALLNCQKKISMIWNRCRTTRNIVAYKRHYDQATRL